jgi:hypothetical protein
VSSMSYRASTAATVTLSHAWPRDGSRLKAAWVDPPGALPGRSTPLPLLGARSSLPPPPLRGARQRAVALRSSPLTDTRRILPPSTLSKRRVAESTLKSGALDLGRRFGRRCRTALRSESWGGVRHATFLARAIRTTPPACSFLWLTSRRNERDRTRRGPDPSQVRNVHCVPSDCVGLPCSVGF